MRIRRIEIENKEIKASVDFRATDNKSVSNIVGIRGGYGSGKTLLQIFACETFRSTVGIYREGEEILSLRDCSGYVEFDFGSEISIGVLKSGKLVQKPIYSGLRVSEGICTGGMLFYKNNGIVMDNIYRLMNDLHKGDIRDSVIWVDDFGMGLLEADSRKLLQLVYRKCLEKNNMAVLSSNDVGIFSGIREGIRDIGDSYDIIERVMKKIQ